MSSPPTLLDFIDDEMLRVPMTVDQVTDAVLEQWRVRMPARARADTDPARLLSLHRGDLVTHTLVALRTSALVDLKDLTSGSTTSHRQPGETQQQSLSLSLSLIDEADVTLDIEIARCTENLKTKAEIALRELQTFTSALANDLNVSRDSNPFRPERFVRALWTGLQKLPLTNALRATYLRDASEPLAKALRRAYTSACQRLEEQGVTPAAYRTIVVNGNTGWGASVSRYQPPKDLHKLRDSMPGGFDGLPPVKAMAPMDIMARSAALPSLPTVPAHPAAPAATAEPGGPDPQLIELLARLFEAIQNDFKLPADTVSLLQRLQPTALRIALRDPSLLDRYDHVLWRFMDQLVHDIEISPSAQRMRVLGLGRNLIDHLAQPDTREQQGFGWALERLLAAQRQALNQAVVRASADIAKLERIASAEATPTTRTMPLDIAHLDTVRADLLNGPPADAAVAVMPAAGVPPGSTFRIYLQGEWRTLQALWQDDHHEYVMLDDPVGDQRWALHQRALARLLSEGLAHRYKIRSLVRRAADKVLRAL